MKKRSGSMTSSSDPSRTTGTISVHQVQTTACSIVGMRNVSLPDDFDKQWESIVGNCDEFVYLGGNEQGTHKYVSELLGKATIDTNTYGRSYGTRGNN